jgi:Rps23 Pro-64 3,4-dihydroxylase Tpa1-like proline 4-hydroxylase
MTRSTSDAGAVSAPIDFERLESHMSELRSEYELAAPWPHLVLDEFLRPDVATQAAASFPPLGTKRLRLARLLEARTHESHVASEQPAIASILQALQSERFTAFLAEITGIGDLLPDPECAGAGMHQGARGSYLHLHADHNTHPSDPARYRRVNVLLYLNERWEPNWNGDLDLWDRAAGIRVKSILPSFNRCAILTVDDTAFHGYGPLRVPRNLTRKAIAAYYYSAFPAVGQAMTSHPTLLPALRDESLFSALGHRVRRKLLHLIEKSSRT